MLTGAESRLKIIHRIWITSICPHGAKDKYFAEFHCDCLITVESIDEAIKDLTRVPIYQEELTRELSKRLNCTVKTFGYHGEFFTECVASF